MKQSKIFLLGLTVSLITPITSCSQQIESSNVNQSSSEVSTNTTTDSPESGTQSYTGYGVPSDSLGNDGDLYLDLNTSTLYIKVNGVWTIKEASNDPSTPTTRSNIEFWTGFRTSYTHAVKSLITRYQEQTGIAVRHTTTGSYDNLQSSISSSVSSKTYPNFTHGYPDHFAGYINQGIQLELDPYIEAYNAMHDVDLLADYYDDYMVENETLKYEDDGTSCVMALPFNKSTEVMMCNSYFVEYAQSLDNTIKIPETWDEWTDIGPKYLAVMDNLYGNYLYANVDSTDKDKHIDFEVVAEDGIAPTGKELLLDCSDVYKERFCLLTWDSTDNMFITIARQWGASYTSYTSEDAKNYQHGWAEFARGDNRQKTIDAIDYFKTVYNNGIFRLPIEISDSFYSSTAFKSNRCMFAICASGDISYNLHDGSSTKIAPIPYKDEEHKFVISQGTNLALFDKGSDEDKWKAFNAMVALSTDELQGAWATETGYYPVSKSAVESDEYQSLLNSDTSNMNVFDKARVESAKLNENYYMNAELGWKKFVDPGFVGSSAIRQEVASIIANALNGDKTTEQILDEAMTRISTYDPNNKK